VPARTVAYAVVALYLGMELLTQLDGDRAPAEELFGSASALAALLGAFAQATSTTTRSTTGGDP
jgi:hypothetical protein